MNIWHVLLCFLLPQPAIAETSVPKLPEGIPLTNSGWCADPVNQKRMICFTYTDGEQTYTVYRSAWDSSILRITWSQAPLPPITIWLKHSIETF